MYLKFCLFLVLVIFVSSVVTKIEQTIDFAEKCILDSKFDFISFDFSSNVDQDIEAFQLVEIFQKFSLKFVSLRRR
jgi:hypothetical protein